VSAVPILTAAQVSLYIQDSPLNNYLLDNEEFSEDRINLAIQLAISEANAIPPRGTYTILDFPNMGLLMDGTLWKLFDGQAAFFARNSLPYSDGGITVNLEERQEAYMSLAANFRDRFLDGMRQLRIEDNIEGSWSVLQSDYSTFPYF